MEKEVYTIPPETPFEVSHAGNLTHVFLGAFWIFLGSLFSDKLHLGSHILWKAINVVGIEGNASFSDATIFRLSGRQRAHKSLVILCEVQ